jgi:hypothetical protein
MLFRGKTKNHSLTSGCKAKKGDKKSDLLGMKCYSRPTFTACYYSVH